MADQGQVEVANSDTEASESPASLARRERLNLLQLESLGTKRRDYISTRDFRENIGPGVSLETVQASRLSNVPGTAEYRQSQAHQQELSAWNTAFSFLADDGTMDEELEDINQGQTHRARLMAEIPTPHDDDHSHGVDHNERNGADRPRGSDRIRGGAKGGRGGGTVGSKAIPRSRKRIPMRCPGNGISTEFDQHNAFPAAESPLGAVKRRSELSNFSVTHSLSQNKTKCLGGEAQLVKSQQRRAVPVSTKWEKILASPSDFMASLAKASSDPLELNKYSDSDSAEIAKSADRHKVVEISEKVDTPKNTGLGREFTDILISTEIDPFPWKSSNLGISYPGGEEKSPVSYSSDLIGLDMAAGSNLQIAADHDRETIHMFKPNTAITPTSQTLVEVVTYLSENLSVIRQALELEMWPQLDAIITRLKAKTEETKALLVKLPQELLLSNEGLSSDTTTDALTRVSEKATTSSTKYSGDNAFVLQSHGPAEDILAVAKASDLHPEGEAPPELRQVSKTNPGLKAKSEKRADPKKTSIIQDLQAEKPEDISVSITPGNAVASHGELEEALAAPAKVLTVTDEMKGKETGSIVSANKTELGSVPEVIVEAAPGLVEKSESFEEERDDQDSIPLFGAPEQVPKPQGEHEEPRDFLRHSGETVVLPQLETQRTQILEIFSASEEDQPSQPNLNASRHSSFSGKVKSHSIFGTHLMPGQAGRERPFSLEHSVASPLSDTLRSGGGQESTELRALGSNSPSLALTPKPFVIEYGNTSKGSFQIDVPFSTSGDSIQSRATPSSSLPQQIHSSEQSGPTEFHDRPKIAAGPLRRFQPFSFARAGPSKMNSPGLFKESSQVAERVALSSRPESPSKSNTKSESQAGTAILCNISTPLSVKRSSVFVSTYFPIRPSRFNRTGLFAPENQHPAAKRPES